MSTYLVEYLNKKGNSVYVSVLASDEWEAKRKAEQRFKMKSISVERI